MSLNTYKLVFDELGKAQRVLIVAHQKPDGDAIGSSLALWHWLTGLGKEAQVFCRHETAEHYHFLAHARSFVTTYEVFERDFDCIVVCDSGDLAYAGIDMHREKLKKTKVINIDHHASNVLFGDVNLVEATASSTCEILYKFFLHNGVALNRALAFCLLTGIYYDTNGFSNPATGEISLHIAAKCVEAGASIKTVHGYLTKNKSLTALHIWGKIFSRLKINKKYGIAYTYILPQDLQDHETLEGTANFLAAVEGVKALIVFHDKGNGQVKLSMRTLRDDIRLDRFATMLGGGGHKKASGCTLAGTLKISR